MSNIAGESFGINDECYKVSKTVLLSWMNEDFQLNLNKIEQLGTGAVYCQILDKIYPGTFNMSGVKWGAKFDYEYHDNYKVLNNAFRKNGVMKNLDVDKLVKCRLLDNTEMAQWIKKYFELHYSGQDYDPVARRNGQDLYYIMGTGDRNKVNPVGANKSAAPKTSQPGRPATATQRTPAQSSTGPKFGGGSAASKAEMQKLEAQVTDLKNNN